MSDRFWSYLRAAGNVCFLLATLCMLSPHAASIAVTPWVIFLFGNFIWAADSLRARLWTWFSLGVFFIFWDMLLVYSRLMDVQIFSILQPIITIMERLP